MKTFALLVLLGLFSLGPKTWAAASLNPPTATPGTLLEAGSPLTLTAPVFIPSFSGALVEYAWQYTDESSDSAQWTTVADFAVSGTVFTLRNLAPSNFGYYRYTTRYFDESNAEILNYSLTLAIRQKPSAPLTSPPGGYLVLGTKLGLSVPEYKTTPGGKIANYLWERLNPNQATETWDSITDWTDKPYFTINKASLADSGTYRYRINFESERANNPYQYTSASASIVILPRVAISSGLTNPAGGITLRKGEIKSHTLSCQLAPDLKLPISFEWQKKVGAAFVEIPAAEVLAGSSSSGSLQSIPENRTLQITITGLALDPDGTDPDYRLLLTNPVSATTSSITLDLKSYPVIPAGKDIQPDKLNLNTPLVLAEGKTGRLSVVVAGERPFYYRWLKKGVNAGDNYVEIANSNSPTLSIFGGSEQGSGSSKPGTGGGSGTYKVEIVNAYSGANFNPTNPFENTLPTSSAEVVVQVIRAPVATGRLTAPDQPMSYLESLPEAPENRRRLTLNVDSLPGIGIGNITQVWQKENISVIGRSALTNASSSGATALNLPSTIGLMVGMVVLMADGSDKIDVQTTITALNAKTIHLSKPIKEDLSSGTVIIFRNNSNRLPANLAQSLDPLTANQLVFAPKTALEAWQLQGRYRCIVSNEVASSISNLVNISILTPPIVLSPPDLDPNPLFGDLTGSITMGTLVSGTPKATYRWTSNLANDQGRVLGTGPSLTLRRLSAAQEGIYSVEVSNPSGIKVTRRYQLQVDQKPSVLKGALKVLPFSPGGPTPVTPFLIPVQQEVAGSRIHLRVDFAGTHQPQAANGKLANGMRVRWYREISSTDESGRRVVEKQLLGTLETDQIMRSENGLYAEYMKTPVSLDDTARYYCVLENNCNSLTVTPQLVTCVGRPEILIQPAFANPDFSNVLTDEIVVTAESDVLSTPLRARAASALSYQWESNTVGNSWFKMVGQNRPQLYLPAILYNYSDASKAYRCRVSCKGVAADTLSQNIYVTTTTIPAPELRPFPQVSMLPRVARAGDLVEFYGSNFRQTIQIFQEPRKDKANGLYDPGSDDLLIPFTVLSNDRISFRVPANTANSQTPFNIVTGGRLYKSSKGGMAISPSFRRSDNYENDFYNPTLINMDRNFVGVLGDNSYIFSQPSQFGTPNRDNFLAKASYIIRPRSRCSLIISLVGGISADSDTLRQTDTMLRLYEEADPLDSGAFVGPDGEAYYKKISPLRLVSYDDLGNELAIISDTFDAKSILLVVDYNWSGPTTIVYYTGGINTQTHGPYSFSIQTGPIR